MPIRSEITFIIGIFVVTLAVLTKTDQPKLIMRLHNKYAVCIAILLLTFIADLLKAQDQQVTILYTNDIESVYEPIDAYWMEEMGKIGGIPYLSTLIDSVERRGQLSFLFDAGDIYTGALSQKTEGRLPIDLYGMMGYDAVNIGNHEFEYGWESLNKISPRAAFPLLNANLFYENTDIRFGRPYAIVEKKGFKVGVIGVMGVDAFKNTINPVHRKGLEVKNPATIVQKYIDLIRDEVDLVVVLTHQNKSAPMQTNKEADPEVQRGFEEDYVLAGKLKGADIILGGHSDNGLWEPVEHPKTGTLIGLTFGQGKHLGYMKLTKEAGQEEFKLREGRLLTVNADTLQPNMKIKNRISAARDKAPELTQELMTLTETASRRYYRESHLGNLFADILRKDSGADVALIHSGSLRADLYEGTVTTEDVLNVYPFVDSYQVVELSGAQVKQMLEHSLGLAYGLGQLSGIRLRYNSENPEGERLIEATVNGEPVADDEFYTVAAVDFLANGGDDYSMLPKGKLQKQSADDYSEVIIRFFEKQDTVTIPPLGRQIDVTQSGEK